MLDPYLVRRLLLALGVAGLIVAIFAAIALANGAVLQDLAANWLVALVVPICSVLITEWSGKLRNPAEAYDRTLEDEWDR